MATEAQAVIRDRRWAQWAPVSGIVFVVLFIVGMSLINLPDGDDSAQKIASFYNDKGDRAQTIIASYLLVLAGVFFFWFLGSLRSRLLAVENAPGRLTSIAFGGGLVFVAMLMAAAACFMTVAADITFGDEKFVSVDAARLLPELGYPILLIGGLFAAIAMVDAASVLIVRTGVLPRWIGWTGFVVAVLLLFGAFFLPVIALLLWVLIVSVAMLRRGGMELLEPRPPAP
jgi:hypothetical protein